MRGVRSFNVMCMGRGAGWTDLEVSAEQRRNGDKQTDKEMMMAF